ncbi:hypothetical protein BJX99DRAFT_81276 [Aspergillus californicus]
MGKGLARLIGSGIGFTSEAIHAARHRNKDTRTAPNPDSDSAYGSASPSISPSETSRALPLEESHDSQYTTNNEPPAYESTTPYWPDEKKQSYTQETDVTDENDLRNPRSMDEDEEAWQLDEAAEEWEGLPTYDETVEANNMTGGAAMSRTNVDVGGDGANETEMENDAERITEADSEKTKEKKRDAMVRALVQMAGPPGPENIRKLPYPVIIPQRRPGAKKRGFVRAYAPVLADSGISQDVFIKFISDFNKASQASLWLQVVVVAADITGWSPSFTVAMTAMAIQIVAETAMQAQIRHRTNSYLDKVNEELFIPRGQYALVMKFKDQPPKQKKAGSPNSFSDMLGGLFSTEKVNAGQSSGSETPAENEILEFDAAATISKITHSEDHPEMNAWTRRMKHYREVSGRTYNALELPECAPLVFPDIDRAAIRVREGKEPKSKVQSGRSWVRDYMDRKTQASFEAEHKGSALSIPESNRKAFVSRYNDPNHPANNGKLLSSLTGGLYVPKPGLCERAGTAIREAQDKKRAAKGLPPSEPWKEALKRKKKQRTGRLKILQEDVMYLMIVNMPTEDELKESVAQLKRLMETEGRTLPAGYSRR